MASTMPHGTRLLAAFCLLASTADVAAAEPACVFKDAGTRMISPTDADDWSCMKTLAANGDAYWQFYVGLQLINGFPWTGGDATAYNPAHRGQPNGLRLLQTAARSSRPATAANAMNALARFYLSGAHGPDKDALAYQWQYLASRQPLFTGTYVFDPGLLRRLPAKRRLALEAEAHELLLAPP